MPDREVQLGLSDLVANLGEDVRRLQRHEHPEAPGKIVEEGSSAAAYSWQSPRVLATGLGHRLYADRSGVIEYIRAERSSADGTSTATFDVLKNGTSLFVTGAKPSVGVGVGLGPERRPRKVQFKKNDWFQVEIETTGGGTGPLRVTIHFTGT